MIWPWQTKKWVVGVAALETEQTRLKTQLEDLATIQRRTDSDLQLSRAAVGRWQKRYVDVNDKFSEQQAPFTQARIDLAVKTERLNAAEKDVERLSFELNTLRDSYDKLAQANLTLTQTRPRANLGSDDLFAEDATQPSRFVDEPDATPAALGDKIARGLAGDTTLNTE